MIKPSDNKTPFILNPLKTINNKKQTAKKKKNPNILAMLEDGSWTPLEVVNLFTLYCSDSDSLFTKFHKENVLKHVIPVSHQCKIDFHGGHWDFTSGSLNSIQKL